LAIVVGALGTYAAGSILPAALSEEVLPPPGPGEPGASFNLIFTHFRVLAVAQLVASVLTTVAGVALLWMWRWAANILETVTWLALIWLVGFAAMFLREVMIHAPHAASPDQRKALFLLVAMPVGVVLFWSTPLLVAIRVLRRPEHRDQLR
jgi:hypothetical protein